MIVRIGDIDLRTYNKICNEYRKDSSNLSCINSDGKRCPFSKPGLFACTAVREEFCEEEVESPDKFLSKTMKNEEEKWPIHNKNEAFQMIIDLADDYDNAKSVESLKSLIDELVEVAKAGMTK